MEHYPVFLNLKGRRCLVVGAGPVGLRKTITLLDCGATEVLLLDPVGRPADLPDFQALRFEPRVFAPSDLDGRFLAVAATGSDQVNRQVALFCRERSVLVNVADDPELSDFIVPSHIRRGPLTFAVATGGLSPALTRHIRERLEDCFGPEYEVLAGIMGRLRPLLLGLGLDTDANTRIFRTLVRGDLLSVLSAGDRVRARELLSVQLPPALQAHLDDLLSPVSDASISGGGDNQGIPHE